MKGAADEVAPQSDILFYPKSNTAYRQEIEWDENGNQIITDHIISNKQATRSNMAPLTSKAVSLAKNKGFSPDTVALVYQYWAQGYKQSQIARAAGISLSTVQHITPTFKRGVKK